MIEKVIALRWKFKFYCSKKLGNNWSLTTPNAAMLLMLPMLVWLIIRDLICAPKTLSVHSKSLIGPQKPTNLSWFAQSIRLKDLWVLLKRQLGLIRSFNQFKLTTNAPLFSITNISGTLRPIGLKEDNWFRESNCVNLAMRWQGRHFKS